MGVFKIKVVSIEGQPNQRSKVGKELGILGN